jgi:hypothetical protein
MQIAPHGCGSTPGRLGALRIGVAAPTGCTSALSNHEAPGRGQDLTPDWTESSSGSAHTFEIPEIYDRSRRSQASRGSHRVGSYPQTRARSHLCSYLLFQNTSRLLVLVTNTYSPHYTTNTTYYYHYTRIFRPFVNDFKKLQVF